MAKDTESTGALGWFFTIVFALVLVPLGAVLFAALGYAAFVGWFPGAARWIGVGFATLAALLLPVVVDLWVSSRYRKLEPNAKSTLWQTLPIWNALWVGLVLLVMPGISRRALESAGGALWPSPDMSGNLLARTAARAAAYIPRSDISRSDISRTEPEAVVAPAPALPSSPPTSTQLSNAPAQPAAAVVPPTPPGVEVPPAPKDTQLFDSDQTPEVLFTSRADSVVLIVTRSPVPDLGPLAALLDQIGMDVQVGSGSGFFVAKDLLVTNHHVIEGAQAASVTLRSGQRFGSVRILADDPVHDLALISADGLSGAPIPLPAADRPVAVGAGALAIGSPLGLEFSLTDGIISAKRKLQGTDFLQMQTPIAPGSSGGPLLNRRGELIGVNTATKSANLNLAVDVKHVRDLLELPRNPRPLDKFVAGVRVTEVETVGVESSSIDRLSYQEGAQWLASSAEHCVQSVPEGAKVTYRSSLRDGDADIESNLDEKSNTCLREKGAFLRKAVGFFLSTAYAADVKAGKEVGLRLTLEGLPRGSDETAPGRPLIISFLVKQ